MVKFKNRKQILSESLQQDDVLVAIDDIINFLDNSIVNESVHTQTLKIVGKLSNGIDVAKASWCKSKKKTLDMIALLSIIAIVPGGVILGPAVKGIKDSIMNGAKPIDAIQQAYKDFPGTVKSNVVVMYKKIANCMQRIIDMPTSNDLKDKNNQIKELSSICKQAKEIVKDK